MRRRQWPRRGQVPVYKQKPNLVRCLTAISWGHRFAKIRIGASHVRRLPRHRLPRPRRRHTVLRQRLRSDGRDEGRALLQHRHDRLSGDHDRPLLCGPGRDLHLPSYRQCRRQHRRRRGGPVACRRDGRALGSDGAVELACGEPTFGLADPAGPDRHRRARHTSADPRHPAAGRPAYRPGARSRGPVRHRGTGRRRPRLSRPQGGGSRPRGHLRAVLPLGRDPVGLARRFRPPHRPRPPRRRHRLRGEAQHPALSGLGGLRSDRAARDRHRPGRARPRPAGALSVQWANMPCR